MKDAIALLCILGSISLLGGGSAFNNFLAIRQENQALKAKIEQLQQQNKLLEAEIRGLERGMGMSR